MEAVSQQESRWHSSHLEASRPETWVELMLQFEFEGKKKKKRKLLSSKAFRQKEFCYLRKASFLSCLDLELIGWGPPILWRAIQFTQSTDLNVNCIWNFPHRNIIMFYQIPGYPMAQSSWHIKLTIPPSEASSNLSLSDTKLYLSLVNKKKSLL